MSAVDSSYAFFFGRIYELELFFEYAVVDYFRSTVEFYENTGSLRYFSLYRVNATKKQPLGPVLIDLDLWRCML